jgi:hypothetical protein
MSNNRKMGDRERRLMEMREARYAENQKRMRKLVKFAEDYLEEKKAKAPKPKKAKKK